MPRPRIANRAKVKNTVVTFKLSPEERETLDALIQATEHELREEHGAARIGLTASSYLRRLMQRDAERLGLVKKKGKR